MKITCDTGWTMEEFLRWAFGSRELAYLAVDIDLARRSTELLAVAPHPEEIRRRFAILTRAIRASADARLLWNEAGLADGLAGLLEAERFEPWMVARLRGGYALLETLIRGRLLHKGKLLSPFAGSAALSAAA
jgi:hypothetical protein